MMTNEYRHCESIYMIEEPLPGERRGEGGRLGRMPREVNTVRTFIFLSFLFKKEVDHSKFLFQKQRLSIWTKC